MNESYWLDQYMDWSGHCSNPALTWTPSQEWRIGVQTHILLEATLQLVIGSPLPFFQYPLTQVMEFCTHKWLLNVCKFVTSIHATFHFKRAWRLDLQCTNDVSLMDSCTTHLSPSPPENSQNPKCLPCVSKGNSSGWHNRWDWQPCSPLLPSRNQA